LAKRIKWGRFGTQSFASKASDVDRCQHPGKSSRLRVPARCNTINVEQRSLYSREPSVLSVWQAQRHQRLNS